MCDYCCLTIIFTFLSIRWPANSKYKPNEPIKYTDKAVLALRQELVNVLEEHMGILQSYGPYEFDGQSVETILAHVERMKKPLEWAASPFLMAAATFFQVGITVISAQVGKELSTFEFSPANLVEGDKVYLAATAVFTLVHFAENHYCAAVAV